MKLKKLEQKAEELKAQGYSDQEVIDYFQKMQAKTNKRVHITMSRELHEWIKHDPSKIIRGLIIKAFAGIDFDLLWQKSSDKLKEHYQNKEKNK